MDARAVLIFGGARGIGLATAEAFAALGARVRIADSLAETGREAAARLTRNGGAVGFVQCDVASEHHTEQVVRDYASDTGRLDVLFNNVGIVRYAPVADLALEDWDAVYRINVRAQFVASRAALPWMIQQGSGVIINTASILAHGHQKGTGAYSSSKAAVLGLTRAIAIDYADVGIRCLSISPGTIDTPLIRDAAGQLNPEAIEETISEWGHVHPIGRIGSPDEVAAVVIFLASDGAGFMTGIDVLIDGGMRASLYN